VYLPTYMRVLVEQLGQFGTNYGNVVYDDIHVLLEHLLFKASGFSDTSGVTSFSDTLPCLVGVSPRITKTLFYVSKIWWDEKCT
jgi:hypothetical protein